jgi:hypothetical protein
MQRLYPKVSSEGTMHRWKSIFLTLCTLFVLALHLPSQTPLAATMSGQILDPGGAAIVGAQIEARQLNGSFVGTMRPGERSTFIREAEARSKG